MDAWRLGEVRKLVGNVRDAVAYVRDDLPHVGRRALTKESEDLLKASSLTLERILSILDEEID